MRLLVRYAADSRRHHRQFYQSRAQMGSRDGESQLIRAISSSVVRELEGCFEVVQTSPDLVLQTREPGEASRLPAHFPTPPRRPCRLGIRQQRS